MKGLTLFCRENGPFEDRLRVRAPRVCVDIGGEIESCNTGRGRGKKATCVLPPVNATCRFINEVCVAVYIMKL